MKGQIALNYEIHKSAQGLEHVWLKGSNPEMQEPCTWVSVHILTRTRLAWEGKGQQHTHTHGGDTN